MMMDLPLILLTLLLSCLGVIYILINLKKWNDYRNRINKIPGPPRLPILGNMLEFIGPLEVVFQRIRTIGIEYGMVVKIWIGHIAMVGIGSPEDVERLISTTKHNSKSDLYSLLHSWLGTGLLTSDGHKWQTRRKILTPSFHFNILQQFLPVFIEQTEVLVSVLKTQTKHPIDIVPYITQFTLISICETAMGTSLTESSEKQEKYRQSVYKMGEHFVYRVTHPWFFFDSIYALTKGYWEQRSIAKFMHNFSYKVLEERRQRLIKNALSGGDVNQASTNGKKLAMLDMLISAKLKGAPIDDEGIREEVDTFMFEGHDTTSMSLSFTLMLLANHQEVQNKIYEEIVQVLGENSKITYNQLLDLKYLERCIKESLRLYPSVPLISRISSEDFITNSGYEIPAGTAILVPIYDIHRNPEVYPNPGSFDPDRFLNENSKNRHPYDYIPFSAGPRNCIGQKFAMMEMKTVIVEIVRNFVLEPVDTPDTIDLIVDLVLRSKNGVKVKFTPRC